MKFLLWFVCIAALSLAGCQPANDGAFPSYAEREYVRVAAPLAGSLMALNVKRGDQVAANALPFAPKQESESGAREEAAARVKRAEA
jgi:HlyD family secretion protein